MPQLFGVPWDLLAILLVLAIAVPWRGAVRVRALLSRGDLRSSERIAIYGSTIVFQWALAGLTAWRCVVHGWRLTSLGIGDPKPSVTIFVGLFLALLLGVMQLLAFRQLSRIPLEQRGRLGAVAQKLMPQTFTEAVPFFVLVCTVSVCEEFLYRGFVFSLMKRVSDGSVLAAIFGSSLIFGIGHYYQGRRGVINTSVLGAIFAAVRAWTGSLLPAMLGHFAVDIIAGMGGSGRTHEPSTTEKAL
jgi:membrane protease YdiL (CAAX protease family)